MAATIGEHFRVRILEMLAMVQVDAGYVNKYQGIPRALMQVTRLPRHRARLCRPKMIAHEPARTTVLTDVSSCAAQKRVDSATSSIRRTHHA